MTNEHSPPEGDERIKSIAKGLYVVATPIGNLRDITFRAVETLKQVDLILCEDTRVFSKLADHYGISTRRQSFHDQNEDGLAKIFVEKLQAGASIALVSDAGTPLISDPGYPLVRLAKDNSIPVHVIPGPCAAIAALSISGFEPNSFYFAGFLPLKPGKKRKELERLLALEETVILYESPHKILNTLTLLNEIAPDREIAIARELTKIYEEVLKGTAKELLEGFNSKAPRGEMVVMLRRM